MIRFERLAIAALFMSVATTSLAQQGPVPIFGLMELSGTGATPGTNFDNGVKLAVKEINASGGILGRKIQYTSTDTQTNPSVAKAIAQKAIDQGAYVVLGPVHSGSMIVSMGETRRAEVANFTGGGGGANTQQGKPDGFPPSFTPTTSLPQNSRCNNKEIKTQYLAILFP